MLFNTMVMYDGAVTADTYSSAIEMLQQTSLSIQVTLTGTSVDYAFTVYESNDGTNYAATSTTSGSVTTSGAETKTVFLKLTSAPSKYYKVLIDKTTNNLTACVITAHSKGV
jgi:hypothetical protein